MITYVLTISHKFPTTHKRKGEETNFYPLILRKVKLHTIRGNYKLWKKRFRKIEKGLACLSIRQWDGIPYKSKQTELLKLDKSHGIGVQKLDFKKVPMTIDEVMKTQSKVLSRVWKPLISNDIELAKNDGLSLVDFKDWFKKYDLSEPMAIIHFTDFRYEPTR